MDDEQPRPTVLTVMTEHGVMDPAWDRPFGTGDPLDLSANDFQWPTRGARSEWERIGLELSFDLQDELWDVEVRSWEGDGAQRDTPVRQRRP